MNPESLNGSAPKPVPMSQVDRAKVFKFPCDGVRRFGVKGARNEFGEGQTYDEAYDMIFFATGGTLDEKGGWTFSPEGVKRIRQLNARYIVIAAKFIQEWFAEQRKKALEAKAAKPAEEPKP